MFSLRSLVFQCILRFRILKVRILTLESRSCLQLTNLCLIEHSKNRYPIFFVANSVYFRGGLVGFSTLNVFSFIFLSLFCYCLLILVLISRIYYKYVLRARLRYVDVCANL